MQYYKTDRYIYIVIGILFLAQSIHAQNSNYLQELEKEMISLVSQVTPAIVTISAKFDYAILDDSKNSLFKSKEHTTRPIEITNIGSGFIIDSTLIITKSSVVNGSQDITVVFHDSTLRHASVVGSDPEMGLSIIKMDTVVRNPLKINTNKKVKMGCWVLVMGNSMGIAPSVSFGIVNSVRKDDVFQVSTNVAAGNAGGAIFNTNGEMVGMLTNSYEIENNPPILGASFFANETVYACSAPMVKQSMKRILERSKFPIGWIGVTAEDWPGQTGGVHLSNITPGGPADNAGFKIGDIVLTINDKKIDHTMELANNIKFRHPGDKVTLQFLRGDGLHTKTVTVGKQPGTSRSSYFTNMPESSPPVLNPFMENVELTSEQDNQLLLRQRIDYLEKEIHSLKNMIEK